jgi:hypothetical protein
MEREVLWLLWSSIVGCVRGDVRRRATMSNSSVPRRMEASAPAFGEEEPTGRFSTGQLNALVTRSLEKSTMFTTPEQSGIERMLPEPPEAPAPAVPNAAPMPTAALLPAPTLAAPAPAIVPLGSTQGSPTALPMWSQVTRERSGRRIAPSARAARRRGFVQRRLLALALLGVVIACQPWWWNVGDLRTHPPATTIARK